jgi:hypothetical protein
MKETSSFVRQERECRNLALDYALGTSILGLIPISGLLTLKLLLATGLIFKMNWDIGARWKFARGQDLLAIAGHLFGWLGAFAMAFMAWLTLLTAGLFVPYLGSFRMAAALFTLTWMLGQTTNQFYASGGRKLTRRA